MIQRTRHLPARLHRQRRRARRFDHGQPISRIDTRPMGFVTMFLAVLFLVNAAQNREHALLIDLPAPYPTDYLGVLTPNANLLAVEPDGSLLWNGHRVAPSELREIVRAQNKLDPQPALLFRPAADTPYGVAAHTLKLVWEEGGTERCFLFADLARYRDFDRSGSSRDPSAYEPRDCFPASPQM